MKYSNNRQSHSIGWSVHHIQWVTKYRYNVFADSYLKNLCEILINEACLRYSIDLDEIEVQPNHVHVLVKLKHNVDPSKATQYMKGYSSRVLWLLEPEKLRKIYWNTEKKHLWSKGKFMGSVGHITLETAKKYLQTQETHHAKSIWNLHLLRCERMSNIIIFFQF